MSTDFDFKMKKNRFKYIYGPVPSWRLGRSLGIDPISQKLKQCIFDCVYCQVGRAAPCPLRRKVYVPSEKIIDEIRQLPRVKIDYITFSGGGEPTLAENLGELIRKIKKLRREPVAVITNASLLNRKDVQQELMYADLVMPKLDASSQKAIKLVNHPHKSITLKKIIKGIKKFRQRYKGVLALQIMFVKENMKYAKDIAKLAQEIKADKIFINTPLRPSASKPLTKEQMQKIKKIFINAELEVACVFDKMKKKISPLDVSETIKRRGNTRRG